jgi:hypothetical protein
LSPIRPRKPSLKLLVKPNRHLEVVVPGESLAHDLLEEFGFVGREDRLRMELGEARRTKGLQTYGTTPYLAT